MMELEDKIWIILSLMPDKFRHFRSRWRVWIRYRRWQGTIGEEKVEIYNKIDSLVKEAEDLQELSANKL